MNEIVTTDDESRELQRMDKPQGIAPMAQLIASGDVSIEQIEKMMELQERWEANEARKAYYRDISAARADMPVIHRGRNNSHLGSTYADLDSMIAGAGPVMGKHNLSFTFEYDQGQPEKVITYCIVTHSMGHTERVKVEMPVMRPVTSNAGKQVTNPAQMVGIAMTYGRRYAFAAALGIATGDDTDATPPDQPPPIEYIDESDMADIEAVLTELGKDPKRWTDYWVEKKGALEGGIPMIEKSLKGKAIAQIRREAKADAAKDTADETA